MLGLQAKLMGLPEQRLAGGSEGPVGERRLVPGNNSGCFICGQDPACTGAGRVTSDLVL